MKIVIEDVTSGDLAAFLREKLATPVIPAMPSGASAGGFINPLTGAFLNTPALLRKLSSIMSYMTSSQKINAIKEVRELFGCGLKEAKDVVEGNFY